MKTTALVIVLLLARAGAAIEPSADQIAAMYKQGEQQRVRLIEKAKQDLERVEQRLRYANAGKFRKDGLLPGHVYFESDTLDSFTSDLQRQRAIEQDQRDVALAQQRIADLEDRSRKILPEIADFLEIGKIGKLSAGAQVKSRQSKTEALVVLSVGRSHSDQSRSVQAFIKGVDCSAVLDYLPLPGIYMVTGTKMLADNPATEEFLLEPVDLPVIAQPFSPAAAPKAATTLPKAFIPVSQQIEQRPQKALAKPASKPVSRAALLRQKAQQQQWPEGFLLPPPARP